MRGDQLDMFGEPEPRKKRARMSRDLGQEGRELRDVGMEKVTPEDFSAAVREHVCTRLVGRIMSWEAIKMSCKRAGIEPHHHNGWGGVCHGMVRAGLLVDTAERTQAEAAPSHAREIRIYEVMPCPSSTG